MLFEVNAHHAEFNRVPARDNVEAEAAVADMVSRHHLLGGKDGIAESHMQRAECGDLLRGGEKPAGPGEGFESCALRVALALIAMPAANWQEKFQPSFIGETGGFDIIVPAGIPALGGKRQAEAA